MSDLSPQARSAAIAGVFDRAAETYDQVGVEFFGPVAEALVERTAPQVGERVLDVGCGRGASALLAARAVGPTGEVVATDRAPAMVRGLREQAGAMPWLTPAEAMRPSRHPDPGTSCRPGWSCSSSLTSPRPSTVTATPSRPPGGWG
jgi:predicted TPR repeat methyltransferase